MAAGMQAFISEKKKAIYQGSCALLSLPDRETAELAERGPVAAGEVHQWQPGHVALPSLHAGHGRWARGAKCPHRGHAAPWDTGTEPGVWVSTGGM